MTSLRRRMAEGKRVRNLSPCTQETYIRQVSLFARHFGKSPDLLGPEQIREHQVHLATGKRLAPGSIAVAVAALRFLYGVTLQKDWNIPEVLPTPKQPAKLPVAPSPEEVVSILDAVRILRNCVVLTTCYAAGREPGSRSLGRPRGRGGAPGPDPPPAITQSMLSTLSRGSGPCRGSSDRNPRVAFASSWAGLPPVSTRSGSNATPDSQTATGFPSRGP